MLSLASRSWTFSSATGNAGGTSVSTIEPSLVHGSGPSGTTIAGGASVGATKKGRTSLRIPSQGSPRNRGTMPTFGADPAAMGRPPASTQALCACWTRHTRGASGPAHAPTRHEQTRQSCTVASVQPAAGPWTYVCCTRRDTSSLLR